jgi:hypothetical protein
MGASINDIGPGVQIWIPVIRPMGFPGGRAGCETRYKAHDKFIPELSLFHTQANPKKEHGGQQGVRIHVNIHDRLDIRKRTIFVRTHKQMF